MNRFLSVLTLTCLLIPLPGDCADGATAAFDSANKDFEISRYEEALAKYRQLVSDGNLSPDLYYNLAASYYRTGQTGSAALWMRRALILQPGMPEASQSLTFLSSHTGYLEFADTGFDRFVRQFPPYFWRWVVSLLVWAGLISVAAAFFVERLKPNRSGLVTLAILCGLGATVAFRISTYRERNLDTVNFATITSEAAAAQTAPTPGSKSVIDLPPGSEVRILQRSGNWCYAEIPGDIRGWIRSESLEPVWPLPEKKS